MVLLVSTLLLTVGASPAQAAPGRAYVVNTDSDTVSVVDTATNTVVDTIPVADEPVDADITPNGARVYVVSQTGGTVSVIDPASNTVVATVPAPWARAITITPNGAQAWVPTGRGLVVIDTATNTVVKTLEGLRSRDVAFSPDGARAYLAADILVVLDTSTYAVVADLVVGHTPVDVEASPDGSRVFVLDSMTILFSVDTSTFTVSETAEPNPIMRDLDMSPDGSRLYVTGHRPAVLLVLDPSTLGVLATMPLDFTPWAVAVSPSGDRVYVTGALPLYTNGLPPPGSQGRLAVVDTATNSVVATVGVASNPMDVEVTSVTPPTPPTPPAPVIEGATFYTDGSSARSGVAPGARVSLFTSSGVPGVAYQLVLSRDGCRTVLAVLNPNLRFANTTGVIGPTAGFVPTGTPAGRYQICFRGATGGGSTITGPVTLDVV